MKAIDLRSGQVPNNPTKNEKIKHNLRSDRVQGSDGLEEISTGDGTESSLWFDNLEVRTLIDYDERIPIVDEVFTIDQEQPSPRERSKASGVLKMMPISESTLSAFHDIHLKTRGRSDPLTDDYFISTHRKREREERHFQNLERDRVMYDKLRIERQLDSLRGHEWIKAVISLTPVQNRRSESELESKRTRLIEEMEAILLKFQSWKDREKKIRADNGNELRLMRERLEDRQLAAKGIKIKARIVRLDGVDSEDQKHRRSSSVHSDSKPARKVFNKEHPLKVRGDIAFGYSLPKIPYRQFRIPQEWIDKKEELRNCDTFEKPAS
ncbi:something about silencing, SAS, complex subunit 4-domain-containing protein [Lipomyces arxii]|uniref:something about silencing, SAS, complex subunit 4-domain-containing protein n=1 Tax=Lipomyces arxii TaxID=56418 RepID=UPI0034D017E5